MQVLLLGILAFAYNRFFKYDSVEPSQSRFPLDSSHEISHKKPLNIVFQFDPRPADQGGNIFETDWILMAMFGMIDRPVRVLPPDSPESYQQNDTMFVFLFEPKPADLFQRLKQNGLRNIGGYHMGDETRTNAVDYYRDASFMFRNYWFAQYKNISSSVSYFPLGSKTGLALSGSYTMMPASQRKHLCSFVGSLRANRAYMISQLSQTRRRQCYISADKPWASPEGIHTIELRNILFNAKFTLCPFGNNEESVRFYESLESGSIPVAQQSMQGKGGDFIEDGLHQLIIDEFGVGVAGGLKSPIPRLSDWKEIDAFFKRFENSPHESDELQRQVNDWWQTYKRAFRTKLQRIINQSFLNTHGVDN